MEQEKWLSVGEVAFRWRCSRDTVIRRVKGGVMKAFILPRVGAKRRCREYLVRMIAESEVLRIERQFTDNR